jgi:putative nucleotidyltransferase with HDIG domain
MVDTKLPEVPQASVSKRRILVVDDEPGIVKLLSEALREEGYSCVGCQSGQEALQLIDTISCDVVVCDVHMPGMTGLNVLRHVREKHPRMGFVMVTAEGDLRVGVEAMKEGADDYQLKPLNLDAVVVSVEQVLKRKRLEAELENYHLHLEEMIEQRTAQLSRAMWQIERTYDETLESLAAALDLRDSETAGHSRRVTAYSVEIAKAVGCSKEQINTIARGALLHDIGKIGIPDAILTKPGPLTYAESSLMRAHVEVGHGLLKHITFLAGAVEIVRTHHERFDGTGYPEGLPGDRIPVGARIFAIADTLDAMTSDRPYRPAGTFERARQEIIRESGKQFDPAVVAAFLSVREERWKEIREGTEANEAGQTAGAELLSAGRAEPGLRSLQLGM